MKSKRQVIAAGQRKGLERALEALNEALLLLEDEIINLGCFPNIRKYVPNGGPITVSSGLLGKVGASGKHEVLGSQNLIVEVLRNHDFVTRYKRGVYNFYAKFEGQNKTRYAFVGVAVRDKVVTTAMFIGAGTYANAYAKQMK